MALRREGLIVVGRSGYGAKTTELEQEGEYVVLSRRQRLIVRGIRDCVAHIKDLE